MKLLELIGCPYIELTSMIDDSEKLTALYLEHRAIGKAKGYTPVFMDCQKSDRLWPIDYVDTGSSWMPHSQVVRAAIEKIASKPWNDWYSEIMTKYVLDLLDDDIELDDEEKQFYRMLLSDPIEVPSDEQYASMILQLQTHKLRIQKYPGYSVETDDDICYVDETDVLALVPTKAPWEVLAWVPLGGFNWCPSPQYQVAFAKHMYEVYGAEVLAVSGCTVEYFIEKPLIEKLQVFEAARDLVVMDSDKYGDIDPTDVFGKQYIYLWWD